jgi:hypothetical protein
VILARGSVLLAVVATGGLASWGLGLGVLLDLTSVKFDPVLDRGVLFFAVCGVNTPKGS